MSTSKITRVAEDYSNRNQSWTFNGTYVVGDRHATLRVEIRANAYQEQSYAKIETWGSKGWRFFNSLPVEDWYATMPSYTKKALTPADIEQFMFVANELVERYCETFYGADGIEIQDSQRQSDYEEALGFSALVTP